jgi:hypothetical protein
MTDTPYIDSLSPTLRSMVAAKALSPRPQYYSAALADASAAGGDLGDQSVLTTLSEDAEAFLILLNSSVKNEVLAWIAATTLIVADPDVNQLYKEVLDARLQGLQQTATDLAVLGQFDSLRSKLVPPTPITDIASMMLSFTRAYGGILVAQNTAVHHRIMDSLAQAAYEKTSSGSYRQELQSWQSIIFRYL